MRERTVHEKSTAFVLCQYLMEAVSTVIFALTADHDQRRKGQGARSVGVVLRESL